MDFFRDNVWIADWLAFLLSLGVLLAIGRFLVNWFRRRRNGGTLKPFKDTVRLSTELRNENKSFKTLCVSVENLHETRRVIQVEVLLDAHEMLTDDPDKKGVIRRMSAEVEGKSHHTFYVGRFFRRWGTPDNVQGSVKLFDQNGKMVYEKKFDHDWK